MEMTRFKVQYKLSGVRRHSIIVKAPSPSDAREKVLDALTKAQVRRNLFVNVEYCEVVG